MNRQSVGTETQVSATASVAEIYPPGFPPVEWKLGVSRESRLLLLLALTRHPSSSVVKLELTAEPLAAAGRTRPVATTTAARTERWIPILTIPGECRRGEHTPARCCCLARRPGQSVELDVAMRDAQQQVLAADEVLGDAVRDRDGAVAAAGAA